MQTVPEATTKQRRAQWQREAMLSSTRRGGVYTGGHAPRLVERGRGGGRGDSRVQAGAEGRGVLRVLLRLGPGREGQPEDRPAQPVVDGACFASLPRLRAS